MAVSVYPLLATASVPNWTLLQTATPSSVATVTFSGLSGYSKYRLKAANLVAATGTTGLTLNGDSTAKYSYINQIIAGTVTAGSVQGTISGTSIAINQGAGTTPTFDIQIDSALVLSPKGVTGWGIALAVNPNSANNGTNDIKGIYQTTSLLTSITITHGAAFSSGTIYLEGAN